MRPAVFHSAPLVRDKINPEMPRFYTFALFVIITYITGTAEAYDTLGFAGSERPAYIIVYIRPIEL